MRWITLPNINAIGRKGGVIVPLVAKLGALDFDNNLWLDSSGNGNDFNIVDSYLINLVQPGAFIGCLLQTNKSFNLVNGFKINFAINISAGGIILGGTNTSNYIWATNSTVLFSTDQGSLSFTGVDMVGGAYNTWNEYEFEVIGTDLKCTNLTTSATETKALGLLTDISLRFLFGRGSTSSTLLGKCAYININDQHEWNFGEGLDVGSTYYSIIDRIGGNHARTGGTGTVSYTKDNNYKHNNLQNGYSTYEDGGGNKIQMAYVGSSPAILVSGINYPATYSKTYDNPSGVDFHNACETAITAPIELLPYDVNNYLFDVGDQPNELLYENIAENVGNQIFANKSIVNKYYDFRVYKSAL